MKEMMKRKRLECGMDYWGKEEEEEEDKKKTRRGCFQSGGPIIFLVLWVLP